jgi:1-deoxy-D-xylulose-5-phosphate reductoisomerase
MRIPIQYALTYPDRAATDLPRLDLSAPIDMRFEPLDPRRFPAFATVLAAAQAGGSAPAAINAGDEVLVSRFLRREIPFLGIADGLAALLERWRARWGGDRVDLSLPDLIEIDHWARAVAESLP